MITLYNKNCLEAMKDIPDNSIDMILNDPPYGTTDLRTSWDNVLNLELIWEQYNRITKENAAIVLFGSQPFTTKLINSNPKNFRYSLIWVKSRITGFANAKKMPLKRHEDISIFYRKLPTYNPQNLIKIDKKRINSKTAGGGILDKNTFKGKGEYTQEFTNYPDSVLYFDSESKPIHPTQKPQELLEYLIKTYSNENDSILDNTFGSGSTAMACINTNRKFIGMELNKTYFDLATTRIKEAMHNKFVLEGTYSENALTLV